MRTASLWATARSHPDDAPNVGGVVQELSVSVPGALLAASVTPGERATFIALQGASEGTRHFELYEHLHRRLPTIGVGIATFDRRGEGQSTGDRSVDRLDLQADDALAVLRALDAPRLGVWGFSQGGWVAPLVAARDTRVACMVGVASTGVSPAEQMLYGVAEHMRRAGVGDHDIDVAMALRVALVDALRVTGPVPKLDDRLQQASSEPWWPLAYLPTSVPAPAERPRLAEALDHDPVPSFRAVAVPALLFYGGDDEWTPVAPSAAAWADAQGENATIVVIPGVGHDLLDPDGGVSNAYDEHLLTWLDAVL